MYVDVSQTLNITRYLSWKLHRPASKPVSVLRHRRTTGRSKRRKKQYNPSAKFYPSSKPCRHTNINQNETVRPRGVESIQLTAIATAHVLRMTFVLYHRHRETFSNVVTGRRPQIVSLQIQNLLFQLLQISFESVLSNPIIINVSFSQLAKKQVVPLTIFSALCIVTVPDSMLSVSCWKLLPQHWRLFFQMFSCFAFSGTSLHWTSGQVKIG